MIEGDLLLALITYLIVKRKKENRKKDELNFIYKSHISHKLE